MNLSTFYSRRDSHPGTSMGGDPGTSQGHSRAPPLEAAAYYYGGPQGHHFHPTTPGGASVDELVAMWLSSGTAPSVHPVRMCQSCASSESKSVKCV
ncbi:unnamed protein product [Callosobruchus maculatus]|uniref:Uncharacterized protein n=1 Tax=Callosobruchus maculatus TaxID=64391 RepID=A0A653CJZ9_CALMS|nr:unnamed protein product [Callosobruchus maculatus]